jgi:hypothetical protein
MITNSAKASNLRDAARLHWRDFSWMWAWPAFFYLSWILLAALGALDTNWGVVLSLFLVQVPALLLAKHKAGRPMRVGAISLSQHLVWAMLVPLATWAVLCLLPFGLLYVLQEVRHAA